MRRAKLEIEVEKEAQEGKADLETPQSHLGKPKKTSEVDLEEERMGLYGRHDPDGDAPVGRKIQGG